MRDTRSIIKIFLITGIILLMVVNNPALTPTSAVPIVLESDILTTNGGTNFTVAYTRESDTWSYNESNEFKLSIDVIDFGSDVINLNTVWFGYRFRNETTGFNYESWSKAIGRASPLQPYWEDRVSLNPSAVSNVPSQVKMTIALKFIENFISVSDEEWSMVWSDVITINLVSDIAGIVVTDPIVFITNTVTATETVTEVTEWITPFMDTYPHDMVVDINQTTGKALPYNITWTIYGDNKSVNNWGNVTLDDNPAWVIAGAWESGVPIVINGAGVGLNKGYHTYTLRAFDDRAFNVHHEVYVSVLNITGFAIDNPVLVASLSNEYGEVPPQIAPFPFTYSLLGISFLTFMYKTKKPKSYNF